ncbi:MAG: phosphoribosyl-AMP cyclohydrolase [Elusimicrobia bacterium]|nr:phosphoribosyl-AMP cyclohydrolase [Elusimicrobiota bacterium]
MRFLRQLTFDRQGLIPAIIQDADDGTVLMVGYMNRQAVRETLKHRRVVFWSRSRKRLWMKGEVSGHIQRVKEMRMDCDGDALLIIVEQVGGACCHTGHRSCFFRRISARGVPCVVGRRVFDPHQVYG